MDDFKLQLSVKIDGQHLLNIRANDAEGFGEYLKWAVSNAEQIQAAAAALEGSQRGEPAKATPAPRPATQAAPSVPAASYVTPPGEGEVGPVLIKSVSKSALKKDGTPMRSPKFTVEFSNGKKLATFDATLAQSAENLSGQSVYYSVSVNGEYTNLAEVRRAG